MAVARDRPGQRPVKKIRGKLHTAAQPSGSIVIKKWPRKRGPPTSQLQIESIERFSWAALASKYSIAEDRTAAELMAADSMYLPRDVLISAMFGNLITIYTTDGRVLTGFRMANKDIQAALDTISSITGAMLVRGIDEWVGIVPQSIGRVLTDNGPGNIPSWQPNAGGGSGGGAILATAYNTNAFVNSINAATILQKVHPTVACTIHAVHAQMSPSAGTFIYKPFIAKMNPANTHQISTMTAEPSQTYTGIGTNNLSIRLPLAAPVIITPGDTWGIGITQTNIPGGNRNSIYGATSVPAWPGFPVGVDQVEYYATNAPAAGDIGTNVNAFMSYGVEVSF